MQKPLRVLNVEDSERDEMLVKRHLVSAGYDLVSWKRVDTPAGMSEALASTEWDVVLCDYAMPHFDALKALKLLHLSGIDLPFIIISGTVGEDIAVQAMLAGAQDYLSKDNLARLVPAIERELREAKNRRELRDAEVARSLSEVRYRALFDYAPDGIIISGADHYYLDANASMCSMLGYDHHELIGMHAKDIVIRAEAKELDEEFELVKSTRDYEREWHFRRKDGSEFPAEVIATIMPDGNLLAMIRDISERKQVAAKLSDIAREKAESLALIDTILSRAPIGFAFHDLDLRYVRINETLAEINGLSVEQHIGRTLSEILPNMADRLEPLIRDVINTGEPVVDYELSGETADPGKPGEWIISFYPVGIEGGEVLGVGVLVTDVTEQRKAADELRESEEKFSGAFAFAPIGVALVSPEGRWLKVNRALCDLIGYNEAELFELTFQDLTHPDELDEDLRHVDRCLAGEITHYQMEKRYIHKLGHLVHVLLNVSLVRHANGDPRYFISQIQDITARKLAEEELRESEYLLAASQRITHQGSWVIDFSIGESEARKKERWSDEHYRIFGFEPGEFDITDENFYRCVHPDDRERLAKTIDKALEQHSPFEIEHRIIRPDGSERLVLAMAELVVDAETGKPRKLVGSVQDITERKKAEAALAASEERYRELVENALDIIYTHDLTGKYTSVNKVAETITGFTKDEILAMNIADAIPEEELETAKRIIAAKLAGEEAPAHEVELRTKDGHGVTVEVNSRIIYEDGIPVGVQGIARDVTERKQQEEARLASERKYHDIFNLAPVGIYRSLSGGTILTVNNALAEIIGYESADELLNVNFAEFYIDPGEREKLVAENIEIGRVSDFDLHWKRKDGSPIWVHLTCRAIARTPDGQYCYEGFVRDVTQSRQMHETLRESEHLLSESQRIAGLGSYVLDIAAGTWKGSEVLDKLVGIDKKYLRSIESFLNLVHPDDREMMSDYLTNEVVGRGHAFDKEHRIIRHNDQAERWVHGLGKLEFNAESEPVRLSGTIQDITERKLAVAEIQEKSALLEAKLDSSIDGVLIVDDQGRQIIRNQRFVDLFKMPQHIADDTDDAKQVQWVTASMKYPDKFVDKVVYLYSNPDEISRDEIELKDGTVLDRYSAPVLGKDNKYYGRIWTFRDITDRKLAEAAVRESELRLRTIIDTEPECVKLLAKDGSLLEMNLAGLRMIEADSFEQVANQCILGLIAEDDRKAFRDLTEKVFRGESGKLEFQLVGRKGTRRWMDTHASPLRDARGEITAFLGITRDVSERKIGEAALLASERRYRDLFRLAPVGIYQSRPDGSFITANATFARMLGYDTVDELLGKNFADIYFDPDDRQKLFDKFGKKGLVGEVDLQWKRKDGAPIWIQLTAHRIKAPDEQTVYLEGFVRDITKQRSVEENLRESDEKFKQLADHISDVFWIRSPDMSKIYYMSPAYEQIWGRKLRDDYADPDEWNEHIFPEDRQRVKEAYAGLMIDQPQIEVEFRILRPDGVERWLRARGFQVRDKSGAVIRLAGIITDITEKKQAEVEIEQTLQRLKDAQRIGQIGDFTWDRSTGAISWSREIYKIVGRDPELGPPKNYEEMQVFFDIPSREVMDWKVALAVESGETQEYELTAVLSDSRRVYIQATSEPTKDSDGEVVGLRGTIQDITTRKRAEAALEDAEEKYRSIFENAVEGIFQSTPDGRFLSANPAKARILGFDSPEELIATRTDIYTQHYVDRASRDELRAIIQDHGVVAAYECEVYKKDGSKIWAQENLRAIRDASGNISHYEGSMEDITERKRAEEALREADQRAIREYGVLLTRVAKLSLALGDARKLETVFEELCEFAFVSTGMDGLIISLYDAKQNTRTAAYVWSEGVKVDASALSPMAMSDSPHSRSVLTGEIIITDDFQAAMEGQPVVHLGGDLPQSSLAVPMSVMGKIVGGVEVQSNHLAAFTDSHATAMQMAANLAANAIENVRLLDIERAQAEQLRQAQKMEAVGVLAGGIAHDFNNLLTAINGFSDMTLRKMEPDNPFRHGIQEVNKAGNRAAELTGQLLAFSRKQMLVTSVINLNSVVSNIEMMLRRVIRESIELRVILDPVLGNVLADSGQIEQVIMNLAINARDAMPEGGHLTIETRNVRLDQQFAERHMIASGGDFVRLTVSDTGEGMDAVTQTHIFEPFFTTKEVGKGTGLGLATVYGIVQQSGGAITVYSEPGHGSTFKVYLPCIDKAVDRPRWPGEEDADNAGTETILLVEDEDAVRSFVTEVLEGRGYNVLAAESGPKALALCQNYAEPIHLLISDVIMPKMGGAELKNHVVELLPDIKVLFISGYTNDAVAGRGIDDRSIAFLEKPFTPDSILRKVRTVLDAV